MLLVSEGQGQVMSSSQSFSHHNGDMMNSTVLSFPMHGAWSHMHPDTRPDTACGFSMADVCACWCLKQGCHEGGEGGHYVYLWPASVSGGCLCRPLLPHTACMAR